MVSSSANAAEWTLNGSIKQDISFNDNVRMQTQPQSSAIYQVIPTINFAHKTEVSQVQASASYGTQRYLDIPAFDTDLQNYALNSYYSTEKSNWGLNASFNVAPARNTAMQESGNFTSNAEKTTWSVSPSYSYKLTELDTLNLLPSYLKNTYSTDTFRDNENLTANLAWQHQWSERYSSSLSFSYSKFESIGKGASLGNGTNSNSYSINLLNSFQWSEKLNLVGSLGGRFTESENKTFLEVRKNNSFGFLVDISVNYTEENYSAMLNLNRSLVPSSTGQLNEQSRVSLDLHYNITEILSASALTSYQTSVSASSSRDVSRKNLLVEPAINWQITKEWAVSASYTYRQQDRSTQDITASSNSVMLSIGYNWQGLSFSR
jgi:hypothetical protein